MTELFNWSTLSEADKVMIVMIGAADLLATFVLIGTAWKVFTRDRRR